MRARTLRLKAGALPAARLIPVEGTPPALEVDRPQVVGRLHLDPRPRGSRTAGRPFPEASLQWSGGGAARGCSRAPGGMGRRHRAELDIRAASAWPRRSRGRVGGAVGQARSRLRGKERSGSSTGPGSGVDRPRAPGRISGAAAARMTSRGIMLGEPDAGPSAPLATAANFERSPTVAYSDGGYLVAWEDGAPFLSMKVHGRVAGSSGGRRFLGLLVLGPDRPRLRDELGHSHPAACIAEPLRPWLRSGPRKTSLEVRFLSKLKRSAEMERVAITLHLAFPGGGGHRPALPPLRLRVTLIQRAQQHFTAYMHSTVTPPRW